MDSFSYLSVILSIVLGLAITQVLLGFRGLILTRAKAKLYGPTIIWALIALLIPIQAWWADFSMRRQANWTFLALLVVMLQAISIYMIAHSFYRTSVGRSSLTFNSTFMRIEAGSLAPILPAWYSAS